MMHFPMNIKLEDLCSYFTTSLGMEFSTRDLLNHVWSHLTLMFVINPNLFLTCKITEVKKTCKKALWIPFQSKDKFITIYEVQCNISYVGRDSSPGIASSYGLDGSGIQSRLVAKLSVYYIQTGPGPTKLPVKWVPGLCSQRSSDWCVALTTQPI